MGCDAKAIPPPKKIALHKSLFQGEIERNGGMAGTVDPDTVRRMKCGDGVYPLKELEGCIVTPDRMAISGDRGEYRTGIGPGSQRSWN